MKRFAETVHRGLGTTARILPISSATVPIRANPQSWSISAGLHAWSNASDGMPTKRSRIYSTTAAWNFASRISARFAARGLFRAKNRSRSNLKRTRRTWGVATPF